MANSVAPRSERNIGLVLGLIFWLGLNGFIPGGGVTWTMPLWLAIFLTSVGGVGIGIYFLRAKY